MEKNLTCTLSGLLNSFTALDVVSLIHDNGKSGQLKVFNKKIQKQVFFQEGEVVFASSNLKDDRLGESLVRWGRLNMDQLDAASKEITPIKKLGKVLVECNFMTPGQLWMGVKNQVEEIFYSVLKMKKGDFAFFEGNPQLDNIVRLSRSVRSLILEGVRNIDELKIFVEKVIGRDTVFITFNTPSDMNLTDVEKELLEYIDGKKPVRQILKESSTTPFVTFKALSDLMLAKVIMPRDLLSGVFGSSKKLKEYEKQLNLEVEEQTSTKEDPISSLFQKYNPVFREIDCIMTDCGVDLKTDLKEYFSELQCPFAGFMDQVEWHKGGGFNEELLKDLPFEQLKRAFEDLLFFLLFKSQDYLPKDISNSLIKILQDAGLD